MAAADGCGGGLGQAHAPLFGRQGLPDRAGRAALLQCVEEFAAADVASPPRRVDGSDHGQRAHLALGFLRSRVPGRHRQPQHIRAGAGITGGDRVDEATHLRCEYRLGGDHPIQPSQLTRMIGARATFEHKCINEPAVKAHPNPHPGLCVVGLLGRHQIVELAVQVRYREHRQYPGDGFVFGGGPARCAHLFSATGRLDRSRRKI